MALGAAIGDFLGAWATMPATKLLVHLMSPDLHKWIPNIIFYTCKVVAITIAWKVQIIISTFYSAIRGGLLVTRTVLRWLSKKGIVTIDPDETDLDEYCGWALAALGFYFQVLLFRHTQRPLGPEEANAPCGGEDRRVTLTLLLPCCIASFLWASPLRGSCRFSSGPSGPSRALSSGPSTTPLRPPCPSNLGVIEGSLVWAINDASSTTVPQ